MALSEKGADLYWLTVARHSTCRDCIERQFGKVKPDGERKGRANKLRHLIEKIRIENKMRPSPPPLGGASPQGEAA